MEIDIFFLRWKIFACGERGRFMCLTLRCSCAKCVYVSAYQAVHSVLFWGHLILAGILNVLNVLKSRRMGMGMAAMRDPESFFRRFAVNEVEN